MLPPIIQTVSTKNHHVKVWCEAFSVFFNRFACLTPFCLVCPSDLFYTKVLGLASVGEICMFCLWWGSFVLVLLCPTSSWMKAFHSWMCLCVCFLQTKMQQLIGLLNDTHITFENGLDVQSLKEDYVKLCESLFQMHKRYFSTNHYLHVWCICVHFLLYGFCVFLHVWSLFWRMCLFNDKLDFFFFTVIR